MIEITFESMYDPALGWEDEDNVSHYINIESPEHDIANQRHGDEIVVPLTTMQVYYTYPLTRAETLTFASISSSGFTRAEVARNVCNGYKQIYDAENAAGDPGHIPGMFNRAQSDGPYGIWGHDIGDLVLHTVYQDEDDLFRLGVDS